MKKNKFISTIIVMIICICFFTGCNNNSSNGGILSENGGDKKFKIVCTTFPQYDWVREIIKGKESKFDITLLLDNGVDLHNYQPTTEDILKVGQADIFVYVGGESDGWVEPALKKATNSNMKVINMVKSLGDTIKEEVVKEGMQQEEEHDHDHDNDDDDDHKDNHGHDEEKEYDEHVWLSLKNARVLVNEISKKIQEVDVDDKTSYEDNTKNYIEKLERLDKEYEDTVAASSHNTILFGDRFPFRYMVDDYNIDYYAAFVGCSAETEASFKTISFLANKIDEKELPVILVIEKSDKKIANTIKDNTKAKNQKILTMNSLQSISTDDINNGMTYIKAMEDNLDVIKDALR